MEKKNGISVSIKIVLSIAGIIFLFFLAWFGTIRHTVNKYRELQSNQVALLNFDKLIENSKIIENQSVLVNKMFSASNELTISEISKVCSRLNHVQLMSFPDAHTFRTDDFIIKTYSVQLKGDYFELLNFIKIIETDQKYGFLISLSFENRMNNKLKQEDLYLNILLQTYLDI